MSRRPNTSQPRVIRASFTRQGNLTPLLMTARNCITDRVYANHEGMMAVIRLNPQIEFSVTILGHIPVPDAHH